MRVLEAIIRGDAAALDKALAAGESPHARDLDGVPALVHAADRGEPALVERLIGAGASLECTDMLGWTPLMAAIARGADEVVELLLARSANANHVAREDTPLTIAVAESPLSTVRLLLDHGADPGLRRPDGWTPLMLAAYRGELDRVQTLLEQGADPTATTGPRLVDAATVAAAHGHTAARDVLIDAARSLAPELGALWGALQRWCEQHAPTLAAAFDATVSDAPLPEAWRTLPPDAQEQLLNWSGGLPFYDYLALSLDEAVATWERLGAARAEGAFADRHVDGLGADEPVQRVYWSDGWVPIARDAEGNLLLVDTAPLSTGIPGQLLSWSVERGPIAVLASGLTPYLHRLAGAARRGQLRYEPRSGGLQRVG